MKNKKLSSDELKKLYDVAYVNRFEKTQLLNRVRSLLKFIHFSKEDIVGDFGCGNGILLKFIFPSIKFYYGIDFSKLFIDMGNNLVMQKKITNARFIQMDINDFCNQHREKISKAFLFDVTEHIYDNELLEILKSIHKSLQQKGILYVHTPNANFIIERMKKKGFILKQFKEHIAVRNWNEMKILLKKAGFKKIEIKFLPHYNFLKILHVFSFLPFIGKFFQARIFIMAYK